MRNDARYLEFSLLSKAFPTAKGAVEVVTDFNLAIRRGEFVSLIGHSGCGKSTVLSIVAGLAKATRGGVILDGREVTGPGTDRGVVFQSPCLLPWMTALDNVLLGVQQVYPGKDKGAQRDIAKHFLGLVGLGDALAKRPAELSAGMRQRVGLARAFALSPKLLLLDEPFGMLDSLTRFELQQVLLDLWSSDAAEAEEAPVGPAPSSEPTAGPAPRTRTALMVTHDVDEALFLSDRIAMMTTGPNARLGGVLEVPFERPRDRARIMENPRYYELREALIGFLNAQEHRSAPVSLRPPAAVVLAPGSEAASLDVAV